MDYNSLSGETFLSVDQNKTASEVKLFSFSFPFFGFVLDFRT